MKNVPETTSHLKALTGILTLLLDQFFDINIINSYSLQELHSLLMILRFVQRAIHNSVIVQVCKNYVDPGFSPIHFYQVSEKNLSNVLTFIRYRIRELQNI